MNDIPKDQGSGNVPAPFTPPARLMMPAGPPSFTMPSAPPAPLMPPKSNGPTMPPGMMPTMPPKPNGPSMPLMPSAPPSPTTVGPPPPLIDWIAGRDLQGPPPLREWLVSEMIPMNNVTLLYGDGGTGKSLIALQLAVSTVLGRIWLNRMPGQGNALYLSAEDDRGELHRRLTTIAGTMNATTADLAALTIANMAGKDALLALVTKRGTLSSSAIFDELERKIAATKPRLIVLDTLADIYPGNENDRAQARQFIGMLRGLAIRHRCAMVLLAHPSLTGINSGTGASGSTGWSNSVRSRLYFERIKDGDHETDPDARRLKVMKTNYARTGHEIAVKWKDGVFIAEQDGGTGDTNARAERIFLTLLERSAAQGRYFSSNYAPNEFAKMPGSEGLTKQMLKSAMERLFAIDKIAVRDILENRRQRKIIAISG